MGLGIVLIFWAVAAGIMAAIAMVVLRATATFLTRSVTTDHRGVLLAASLFPFVCLAWGGAVFIFQAIVNETVFHRDPGIGDSWRCPLPNGYALLMIDVTDSGVVYNPKTQPLSGGVAGDREDAVSDVSVLQVAGRYIVGGTDSHVREVGTNKNQVYSYFLLDTVTGRRTHFTSLDALRGAALPVGIEVRLEPIRHVYYRYRFTWFDLLAAMLLCGPPLLGLAMLGRWIVKLRRASAIIPLPG
jgi:hypothetical protein